MSQAGLIDGFQFARSAGELKGELHQSDLPRLAESQCVIEAVRFALSGAIDPEGRPMLRVSVRGGVHLVCQRCLGPIEIPLQIDSELLLVRSERETAEADDDLDRIVGDKAMDVAALIEDEILLVLPMVPRHEHCDVAPVAAQERRPSPFAMLGKLKS